MWRKKYYAVVISVRQISRKSGGLFPPHKSHRQGVDVDVRPIRNDLQNKRVTYTDHTNYNPDVTRELIKMVRAS